MKNWWNGLKLHQIFLNNSVPPFFIKVVDPPPIFHEIGWPSPIFHEIGWPSPHFSLKLLTFPQFFQESSWPTNFFHPHLGVFLVPSLSNKNIFLNFIFNFYCCQLLLTLVRLEVFVNHWTLELRAYFVTNLYFNIDIELVEIIAPIIQSKVESVKNNGSPGTNNFSWLKIYKKIF